MDLHIVGADPTSEERDAVDALLGPPESGWGGARRNVVRDMRASYGGLADVKNRRDLLLPALHAVQDRVGWISRGALNYICTRLVVPPAEAWGVVTFYHLFKTEPAPPIIVHVCDDIACRLEGAERLCNELQAATDGRSGETGSSMEGGPSVFAEASTFAEAPADRRSFSGGWLVPPEGTAWTWQRSPCLGQCDRAPAALVVRAGARPTAESVTSIGSAADIIRSIDGASIASDPYPGSPRERDAGSPGLLPGDSAPKKLLRRAGVVDPTSLAAYREHGGYRALTRAIELGSAGVIDEVIASNLLGRGGAAFPTGRKWDAVARERARPHFLVCNADESEPGTFKDRVLLEADPFGLIEAMTIAGYATGCEEGFVYIRGEYPLARARVQHAIDLARQAGVLGAGAIGPGTSFDLEVRRGAGAYICGEETALFNSLEGRRGEPRSKPPFPAQVGLFGKPTVVNNVETLLNVLDIVLEGGLTWATIGTKASTGTRLFCVSGHVERPGLYEAPFGIALGDVVAMAGGVVNGRSLQAILLGGAAGTFVGPDALSMRLTFEDVRVAGATLGSGVVMVFDDTADIPDTLLRIGRFMEDESCGQCVPCRVGTVRQVELLQRLIGNGRDNGRRDSGGRDFSPAAGTSADLLLLTELGQAMRDASICGLGQTASSAIESAVSRLHLFRTGGAA